jgi:hypothetical protein
MDEQLDRDITRAKRDGYFGRTLKDVSGRMVGREPRGRCPADEL